MLQFFKTIRQAHNQLCSVLVWGAWRCTSASPLASTVAQLKYHRTTVFSFREQGEKQIPSCIISQATGRRVVQYSTRHYSELTWVYFKKDTSCDTGKWWPNSILIKKCVSVTAVSIIFIHPLYMLPSYIPWGDWISYVSLQVGVLFTSSLFLSVLSNAVEWFCFVNLFSS